MKKTIYDFSLAADWLREASLSGTIDELKGAALRLSNAKWEDEKRDSLILSMQSAVVAICGFLDSIIVREVEQ